MNSSQRHWLLTINETLHDKVETTLEGDAMQLIIVSS
jgi:hypothetical protein